MLSNVLAPHKSEFSKSDRYWNRVSEGLHLALAGDAPAVLVSAYADLLVSGKIHAPIESIHALNERLPSAGVDAIVRAIEREERIQARNREAAEHHRGDHPTIQLKRVIQIIVTVNSSAFFPKRRG